MKVCQILLSLELSWRPWPDGRALLVNFKRGVVLHHFNFQKPVKAVKFSPDGRYANLPLESLPPLTYRQDTSPSLTTLTSKYGEHPIILCESLHLSTSTAPTPDITMRSSALSGRRIQSKPLILAFVCAVPNGPHAQMLHHDLAGHDRAAIHPRPTRRLPSEDFRRSQGRCAERLLFQ